MARIELDHEQVKQYLTSESIEGMLNGIGDDIMRTLPKRHYHMKLITWTKYPKMKRKVLKMYVQAMTSKNLDYKANRLLKGVLAYKK